MTYPEDERPDADVAVARFLRELKPDYVDLLLLHCVTSPPGRQDLRRQMDIQLRRSSRKASFARLASRATRSPRSRRRPAEPWVESVHTRINPFGMSMDEPPDHVVPVLQRIHAAGKGVIGMKIMGEGRLRTDDERRDASVRYALTLGCVDVLNVGCESLAEVTDAASRRVERA